MSVRNILPAALWAPDESGVVVEGLFEKVPEDIYHKSAGLSGTDCKLAGRSLAHFRAAKSAKEEGDDERKSAALNFGKLAHAVVLEDCEGAEFDARFAVKPADFNGRTNEGKAWVARNAGKTIVSEEDIAAANGMRGAIEGHTWASALLCDEGISELSIRVRHPRYGILLRGRPDKLRDAGTVLPDYKTALDASPEAFAKAAHEYGYLLQARHYLYLCELTGLSEVKDFAWIVQEKAAPFALAVYTFGPTHEKWQKQYYNHKQNHNHHVTLSTFSLPCPLLLPHFI